MLVMFRDIVIMILFLDIVFFVVRFFMCMMVFIVECFLWKLNCLFVRFGLNLDRCVMRWFEMIFLKIFFILLSSIMGWYVDGEFVGCFGFFMRISFFVFY